MRQTITYIYSMFRSCVSISSMLQCLYSVSVQYYANNTCKAVLSVFTPEILSDLCLCVFCVQIQGEKAAVEATKNIRYRGVFGTISTMVRTEGPRSLYNGLVAGLQRQMAFASIRIGLYDNVKSFYTGGKDSE